MTHRPAKPRGGVTTSQATGASHRPIRRVAVLAVGSGGDVAPLAAIAAAVARRGFETTLLAPARYARMAAPDVQFQHIGADDVFSEVFDGPAVWTARHGLSASWRYYGAALQSGIDALESGWSPADTVLISSTFALAARLAEARWGFRNTTVHLSPAVIFSRERPSRWPAMSIPPSWPRPLQHVLAGAAERFMIDPVIARAITPAFKARGIVVPRRLFSRLIHSPHRVAYLFPPWFAGSAADWPAAGRHAGFARPVVAGAPLPEEIEVFLATASEPVVVVTAGTAVADRPAWVDRITAFVVGQGARVVLVEPGRKTVAPPRPGVLPVSFVAFDQLLPKVHLLVHHGGIGTAAEAIRAGCVQWLVPSAHDQADNAEWLRRLGLAQVVSQRPTSKALAQAWEASLHACHGVEVERWRRRALSDPDGADLVASWAVADEAEKGVGGRHP
jgi:rhamnosyltransferase subunit B